MRIAQEDLEILLNEWLPLQRWFSGKGREMTVTARPLSTLISGMPEVSLWLADVHYSDGTTEIYQLPLVLRDDPVASLDHVLLGSVWTDGKPHWVYDALHDKEVTQVWLEAIRDDTRSDQLLFHRYVDVDDIPVGEPSLALTGEQTNTSLIYGDAAIMKVFRRLESGINPDIEVHEALAKLNGPHIATLLGSVTAQIDGVPFSLAMLSEFMTTATDGWGLAKISVRDLMAEGDLHAEEAGGDFGGEAQRLGSAVAEVHANLATAFGTDQLGSDELRALADGMHARLDAALEVVPQLSIVESGIRSVFDRFAATPGPVVVQRIHGDLHLGQVLRTVRRWVLIDFEGEPVKRLAERRAFDSPLRDVAGMMRSFVYAARHQIVDIGDSPQREYRALEWIDHNIDAFCRGYAEQGGNDPREASTLLQGYQVDKAVYEAMYEARHRPSWLTIPVSSLGRLIERIENQYATGTARS